MKIVHSELLKIIVIQKYWVFHFISSMIFSEHATFTKCIRLIGRFNLSDYEHL